MKGNSARLLKLAMSVGWLAMCTAGGQAVYAEADTIYFFDGAGRLSSVSSDGTDRKTLSEQPSDRAIRWPQISHDNRKIAYLSHRDQGTDAGMWVTVYDMETGTDRNAYQAALPLTLIGFSPDSGYLAVEESSYTKNTRVLHVPVCHLADQSLRAVPLMEVLPRADEEHSNFLEEAFWTDAGRLILVVKSYEPVASVTPTNAPTQEVWRVLEYDPAAHALVVDETRTWLSTAAGWQGADPEDRARHTAFESAVREHLGKFTRHVNAGYRQHEVEPGQASTLREDAALRVDRFQTSCELSFNQTGDPNRTVIMESPLIDYTKMQLCPLRSPRWLPGDAQAVFYEQNVLWKWDRATGALTKLSNHAEHAVWMDPQAAQRAEQRDRDRDAKSRDTRLHSLK